LVRATFVGVAACTATGAAKVEAPDIRTSKII
jgi:hypothetical protein